jgi:hypothetical protein
MDHALERSLDYDNHSGSEVEQGLLSSVRTVVEVGEGGGGQRDPDVSPYRPGWTEYSTYICKDVYAVYTVGPTFPLIDIILRLECPFSFCGGKSSSGYSCYTGVSVGC